MQEGRLDLNEYFKPRHLTPEERKAELLNPAHPVVEEEVKIPRPGGAANPESNESDFTPRPDPADWDEFSVLKQGLRDQAIKIWKPDGRGGLLPADSLGSPRADGEAGSLGDAHPGNLEENVLHLEHEGAHEGRGGPN